LARDEAKIARTVAKELAPDYHQPGTNIIGRQNFKIFKALNIYVRPVVSMIMMIKKKLFK